METLVIILSLIIIAAISLISLPIFGIVVFAKSCNCFSKLDDKIGLIVDEILNIINAYTTDGNVNIPRIIYEINKARNYVSLHDWKLVKEHEMRPMVSNVLIKN